MGQGLMRKSPTFSGQSIICGDCGGEAPKRSTVQKYCLICSAKHDLSRKAKWAQNNPLNEQQKQRRAEQKKIREEAIKKSAALDGEKHRSNITWPVTSDPSLMWVTRISVPFDYGFSKNAIWSMGGNNHVYLRKRSKQLRDALCLKLKASLAKPGSPTVVTGKVWVDILVQKPNHRGDAVNVIDSVCDALKEAIGIDDRWFGIRKLDWEIVKENPMLFVGIGQESNIPQRACSYCGLIKSINDNFPVRKHGPDGYGRICRACETISERARKRERKPRLEIEVMPI